MQSGKPIRILSVDDHPVFHEGLSAMIGPEPDMLLVGRAETARDALAAFRLYDPDITLMDRRLPGGSGVDVLIAILNESPTARIVMLTASEAHADIRTALRAGAKAYLLKSAPPKEMLSTIRSVYSGEHHVCDEMANRLKGDNLTPREFDILRLMRDGHRNKEISARLAIAETTVNFHVKNVVTKLRANDRTHAVTLAARRGLLEM